MADFQYSGTMQLEIMAEAKRYNRFLETHLFQHVGDAPYILDFGAGTGQFADAMQQRGQRISCLEPDVQLRTSLEARGYACHSTMGEISAATFDAAYTLNVLEHIEDDVTALSELFSTLKPGAPLFVYVPAFPCLYSSMDHRVGHIRRYTRPQLVCNLRKAGFIIEDARYADFLGFFATLLFKLIGKRDGNITKGSLVFYDRLIFPLSRILDYLHLPLGKNLMVCARKPNN